MQKAIFIAEKNYIIENTRPVYQKMAQKGELDYQIEAFFPLAGHVMEFDEPNDKNFSWAKVPYLPQNIMDYDWNKIAPKQGESLFRPSKRVMGNKSGYQRVKPIADFIKNNHIDFVINAGDSDREGTLLVLEVLNYLGFPADKSKRFWIKGGFTDDKVADSLKHLLPIDYEFSDGNKMRYMYQASELRSQIDRVMGYSYSPALSLKTGLHVRAGRIKLPTLNIVVKRDLEIKNFKPKTYYEISQDFKVNGGVYTGDLIDDNNKKQQFDQSNDAQKVAAVLKQNADSTILEADSTRKSVRPPQFLNTNDVKRVFLKKYGNKAIETAMENLYHKYKIMTYPRTDTQYVSKSDAQTFPALLKAASCVPKLAPFVKQIKSAQISKIASDKRYVDDKKAGAHEALVPTNKTFNFDSLPELEQKIIEYVDGFFVQAFLPDQVLLKSRIITQNGPYKLLTSGQIQKDPGWTVLFNKQSSDKLLPSVKKGDQVQNGKVDLVTKQTTPPSKYTVSSLINAMGHVASLVDDVQAKKILRETKGLGTDTSQGAIVDGLIQSGLLTTQGKQKQLTASKGAVQLILALSNLDIIDPISTADFETKLAQVQKGEIPAQDYQKMAFDYVAQQCDIIKNSKNIPMLNTSRKVVDTGIIFNKQTVTLREGKYGKYYTVLLNNGKNCFVSQSWRGITISVDVLKQLLTSQTVVLTNQDKAQFVIKFDPNHGFSAQEKNAATGISYKNRPVTKHNGKFGPYYQVPLTDRKSMFISIDMGTFQITPDLLKLLLDGDVLKDKQVQFKSGKYICDLKIDFKKGKLVPIFKGDQGTNTNLMVGKDKLVIKKGKYGEYYNAGQYNLGKKWSSHLFTPQEACDLLNGKQVHVKFTSKSGKQMETDLKYDKRKGKIVFAD